MASLRSKNLWVSVLLVICLLVAYFLLYKSWTNLSDSRLMQKQVTDEHQKLTTAQNNLDEFLQTFKASASSAAEANNALPAKDLQIPSVLDSLQAFAQLSGLTLSNVSLDDKAVDPQHPALDNSIQTQNITINASGSFPSFRDFLLRIQSHLRLMDIISVNLKAEDTGNPTYQIQLRVYYQK